MVQVIYPKCAGLVEICSGCGAIISYQPSDIICEEGKEGFHCPVCNWFIPNMLVTNYDGVVSNPNT